MFIFFPITWDAKRKLVLCAHSYIPVVFSPHGITRIGWDMFMLLKKKKKEKKKGKKNGRGWFF